MSHGDPRPDCELCGKQPGFIFSDVRGRGRELICGKCILKIAKAEPSISDQWKNMHERQSNKVK